MVRRRTVNPTAANRPPRLEIEYHPHSRYLVLRHQKAATDGELALDLLTLRSTYRILVEIAECHERAPELLTKFLRVLDYILRREFRYTLLEISKGGFLLNWEDGIVFLRQ